MSRALHGSGDYPLGIEAHSSVHPGMLAMQERQCGPRFEQGLLGPMPVYAEDDGAGFYWPGSYRQAGFRLIENSNSGAMNTLQLEEPDLTLRL